MSCHRSRQVPTIRLDQHRSDGAAPKAFLASWSIERTCDTVAAEIASALDAAFSAVLLYDPRTGELASAGAAGTSPRGTWPFKAPVGSTLAGRVIESGEPVAVLDVQDDPHGGASVARESGVRSYVAVPLRSRDGVVGAVVVGDMDRRPALLEYVGVLEQVANHLAQEVARRRAENALAESELRFRTVFEASRDAIGVSANGTHVFVNPAYVQLFGYDDEAQLVGTSILALIAPADRQIVSDRVKARGRGVPALSNYTVRGLRRSGEEFEMDVHLSTYTMRGVVHTLVVLRDISEQVRLHQSLVESEARHRELFEQVPVGLWEEDMSAVKRELDSLDEGARSDLRAYLRAHPEVTARCAAAARILHVNKTVLTTFGAASEQELIGNLDKVFNVESLGPFGDAIALLYAGAGGFRVEGTNRTLRGDARWVDLRASCARGHEQDWAKVLVSTTDITDLKRAEAERSSLEQQLQHARRLEAIGTLAGGVAHDFNNILAAIIGFGELAQLQAGPCEPVRDDLDQILKAAYRARDLVQQILAFSRRAIQERKLVDLNELVAEAARLLRATTPANIELRVTQDSQDHAVIADPSQLHQVLMNLCANARWALRDKPSGLLEIALASVRLGTASQVGDSTLPPGDYVRLSVIDDGCGMDEATMARVFEPYFTSKPVGQGSGLGLSVVHGIVASHGGAIQLASSPGAGARFDVLLPRADEEARRSEPAPGEVPARGAEHVLFVDDEPAVAEVGTRMLQAAGYRVTATTSAREALGLFRSHPDDFDLIISDQSLPYMTGAALVVEFLRVRKDIRIILCTGFSETIDEDQARRIGARRLLMKPFDMKSLIQAVRQVLDND